MVHALVIDGVFAQDGERLRFQAARRLTRDDVAEVVAVVAHGIDRLLQRRGVIAASGESGGADRWAEEAPALAGLAAASVQGLLALGPRSGARIARYGGPPEEVTPATLGPCHAKRSMGSTCTRGSSTRLLVGRADAADVWDRRARVPALWRPAAVARADRAREHRGTHPPAFGPAHRRAGAAARSRPAAAPR
jgi:hypothetical protein